MSGTDLLTAAPRGVHYPPFYVLLVARELKLHRHKKVWRDFGRFKLVRRTEPRILQRRRRSRREPSRNPAQNRLLPPRASFHRRSASWRLRSGNVCVATGQSTDASVTTLTTPSRHTSGSSRRIADWPVSRRAGSSRTFVRLSAPTGSSWRSKQRYCMSA